MGSTKIALVTGSNKGIGLAVVERLARFYTPSNGWHVMLTARDESRGLLAREALLKKGIDVKFHQLDITQVSSRHRFLEFIKSSYLNGINVLVNNAGIACKDDSPENIAENARLTVNTNFTSTIDFTLDCLPIMGQNSRIVNVTSTLSRMTFKKLNDELRLKFTSAISLDDLHSLMNEFVSHAAAGDHEQHGWPTLSYGLSKLALMKATDILHTGLQNDPRKILINSCCPGYVDTDLTDHKGRQTPDQGADTPFYLATLPDDCTKPNGEFVYNREIRTWLNNQ